MNGQNITIDYRIHKVSNEYLFYKKRGMRILSIRKLVIFFEKENPTTLFYKWF